MSHATYDKLWREAQDTLEDLGSIDAEIQGAKPTKDRKRALAAVKDMFVKYVIIVNKLDQCYDQMVHPQKRLLAKRLLDLNICRVIELRQEMVVLENSEHSYYDEILAQMGILPMDGDLRVPKYYRLEREDHFRKWRNEMDSILKKLGYFDDEVNYRTSLFIAHRVVPLSRSHKRQKPQAPTPQAPIRNRQTRKVANA